MFAARHPGEVAFEVQHRVMPQAEPAILLLRGAEALGKLAYAQDEDLERHVGMLKRLLRRPLGGLQLFHRVHVEIIAFRRHTGNLPEAGRWKKSGVFAVPPMHW